MVPPSFLVLPIWIGAKAQEQICALVMAESDRVEERRATVVVARVDLSLTEPHQGLNAVKVASVKTNNCCLRDEHLLLSVISFTNGLKRILFPIV